MVRVVVDVTISEIDSTRIGEVEAAQQAFLVALAAVGILDVRAATVTTDPLPGEPGFERWAQDEASGGFDGGVAGRVVE